MGDHHMAAKSVFLEGSSHIPLLIRPPHGSWEISPLSGKKCDTIVDLADIMPTILDIAGIKAPDGLDGKNLIEIASKPAQDRTFYGNCDETFFCVIEGHYKYHWTALGGAELLFDLRNDPYEQKNLAVKPENYGKLKHMRAELIKFVAKRYPDMVQDGKLIYREAPKGPEDVPKWPGFHSTVFPTDVLH